jgi:predicted amidohydrolase
MWNCPYSNDSFPTYAEDIDNGPSPSKDMLSAAAKAAGVTLVGGSVPERSDGKLYNTCCVFDHNGKLLAKHRWVVSWQAKPIWRKRFVLVQGTVAVCVAVHHLLRV